MEGWEMKNTRISVWRLTVLLITTFVLTGCVNVNISVDVRPNGSSTLLYEIGMSKQLISMAGGNQSLTDIVANNTDYKDAEITTRADDNNQYVMVSKVVNDIDSLNILMANLPLFNSFYLQKIPGLFSTKYILDAEMVSSREFLAESGQQSTDSYGIDASQFLTITSLFSLPGKISETNGVFNKTSGKYEYQVVTDNPTKIHIVSQSINIIPIVIFGGIIFLIIIGSVWLIYTSSRKKNSAVSESNPEIL
jgi:hypothetical protein